MKTLRKLSNRKLDQLQDRISAKYWREADVAPRPQRKQIIARINRLVLRIGNERLRRMGL